MIDLKTLRQLVRLMKENDLSEVDIRDNDEQVTLKRGGSGPVQMAAPVAAPLPAAAPVASAAPAAPAAADEGLHKVTSPMVGTYYAAPSPDAEAYVKIGGKIGEDSVICIIEAMKVFNEIKAECSGTIEKILVASGEAVEFGQPLFLVRPD